MRSISFLFICGILLVSPACALDSGLISPVLVYNDSSVQSLDPYYLPSDSVDYGDYCRFKYNVSLDSNLSLSFLSYLYDPENFDMNRSKFYVDGVYVSNREIVGSNVTYDLSDLPSMFDELEYSYFSFDMFYTPITITSVSYSDSSDQISMNVSSHCDLVSGVASVRCPEGSVLSCYLENVGDHFVGYCSFDIISGEYQIEYVMFQDSEGHYFYCNVFGDSVSPSLFILASPGYVSFEGDFVSPDDIVPFDPAVDSFYGLSSSISSDSEEATSDFLESPMRGVIRGSNYVLSKLGVSFIIPPYFGEVGDGFSGYSWILFLVGLSLIWSMKRDY